MESAEVQKLKSVVKSIIKKQGYQYSDLAKALNVSPSTINRILNREEISLERFQQILEWLGMSFFDVAEIAKDLKGKVSEHSAEQEEFLANNPQHLLIFEYIRDAGYSAEQIEEKYRLTRESMDRYLQDLEKQNLIELYPNGKIKPLINHIRWRPGGALRRTYAPKMGEIFNDETVRAMLKNQKDESTHHRGSLGILMRKETFLKMKAEIDDIEKKYRAISKMEVPLERKQNLSWVIYSFLMATRDLRDKLYEAPKNYVSHA